jgi:uroporphyrin-III C-methyltransferase / precorrin-2 dehydrogenase / sirohydrochlorin ferrochelatase
MEKHIVTPNVILAGAGPGDVDLITVKAVKYLENAAFVLTDRLVNPAIIQQYASPNAEIVYVGKHGGKESAQQEDINRLLVDYGQRAGLTVRLKGGDVAFFSNVLAEMEALRAHQIPFEVVPGITAASGASASINMPLTARGHAQGVRLLTFKNAESFSMQQWQELAETTDTLVFYMASQSLAVLINQLQKFTVLDKGVAVIEQATTSQQRVLTTSLLADATGMLNTEIRQPALVVMGSVTQLYTEESQSEINTIPFFKEH